MNRPDIDSRGVLDAYEYMEYTARRREERRDVRVCVVCGDPDEDGMCEQCKQELPIKIKGANK